MSDRLPPLTALRAFEAAARHMSFAKAADELNVTPAALSFQIRNLEDHLGHPLFHRLNRAVDLTEAGQRLSPGVSDAFDRLAAAWASTTRLFDTQILSVTAGPAFTAKWLAPRLYEFAQAHPEIELRFAASLRIMDLARDGVDAAIRFGLPQDDGLYSVPLMDEVILPLATPQVAELYPTPQSLEHAPLIFDDSLRFLSPSPDWERWLSAAGQQFRPEASTRFSQADHALDAALAGGGIVLSRMSLARHYVNDGRLVAPYKPALTTPAHFRFVCQMGNENRPQIAAFKEWLIDQIARMPPALEDKELIPVERNPEEDGSGAVPEI